MAYFQTKYKKAQVEPTQVEMLSIFSDRFYCLIKLSVLLSCGKKSVLNTLEFDFNLKSILLKGKGIFSELSARHIVLNEFPAKLLSIIDTDEDKTQTDDTNKIDDTEDASYLLKDENYLEFYGFIFDIELF